MKNDNMKSLARNSVYNVLYKLLYAIFPLVSAAYVSRVLLPEGAGKVSYAQNIVQYFTIIAALGLLNYGTREIARSKSDVNLTNKIFTELFCINFISTLSCSLLYYIMIQTAPYFAEEKLLYSVAGLSIILNLINVDWFYQGQEEYAYIVFRSFVIKLLSLFALFIFVKTREDYVNYALISCVALAGNNIFNMINLKRFSLRFTFHELKIGRHMKPVFIMLATSIAIELYTLLDTTMLGILCDDQYVAYYTYSIRVIKILIVVITALGGALLPRLSYYRSQNMIEECNTIVNKMFAIMLFLFLPCGLGILLTADLLVPILFDNSFLPAVTTMQIASLLIFVLGFSNLFGTQVLITFGGEKKLLMATVAGAVTNIILNLILIRMYQQNGAAIASVISETCVTLLTYHYARKYIQIKRKSSMLYSITVASVVLVICVIAIKLIFSNIIIEFVLSVICGAGIYFIVNLIMKNEILMEFHQILKHRLKKQN